MIADLTVDLPSAVRLQRLVATLKQWFQCGAVVLLRLEDDVLRPIALDGLVHEALGRRFPVADHPRLASLLRAREPLRFDPNTELPDPYDGLLIDMRNQPLPVHDCMGISLHVEGELWGVLTLDALKPGTFGTDAVTQLALVSLLVEAAIRMGRLEESLKGLTRVRATHQEGNGRIEGTAGGEIIGHSPALKSLLSELAVVAESDLPVLLLGETGVGKELFARRLHQWSSRADKPLVQVNCAALPENLAESELFGHVKGAFSGAANARPGKFEAAEGGTLLLDEVGELPLTVQAKLLRTLQNGEIQRLGSDKPSRVDVRIIAATNRDLAREVRDGRFRADLYHRLSVYPLPIPPLRERREDILPLAGYFLELNRTRLGVRSFHLSPSAEEALCNYHWPGNIRELEHVISRAALKALTQGMDRSDIISLHPSWLNLDGSELPQPPTAQAFTEEFAGELLSMKQTIELAQRQQIKKALDIANGNWRQAASLLEVDASNLRRMARRLGAL